MGNGSTQPSKTQLVLKKRQRAQHHQQSSKSQKTARPSKRGKCSTHLAKTTQMQLFMNKCNLSQMNARN
jgi:hypothetical protein